MYKVYVTYKIKNMYNIVKYMRKHETYQWETEHKLSRN